MNTYEPERLSRAARSTLQDSSHTFLFSAASLWEIASKLALGRAEFTAEPGLLRRELLRRGYGELGVACEHAVEVSRLPGFHRDPFDRLLVAQARVEGITLLTVDAVLAKYGGAVRRV